MVDIRDHVVPHLKVYDPHYLRLVIEASNMVTCGELFLRAAPARMESRGSHLREDRHETEKKSLPSSCLKHHGGPTALQGPLKITA